MTCGAPAHQVLAFDPLYWATDPNEPLDTGCACMSLLQRSFASLFMPKQFSS